MRVELAVFGKLLEDRITRLAEVGARWSVHASDPPAAGTVYAFRRGTLSQRQEAVIPIFLEE